MDQSRPDIPLLWLCGPSGVGKTAVARSLYAVSVRDHAPVAYVDIDQLGICSPEPLADPGRHRLKLANLRGVLSGSRGAGVDIDQITICAGARSATLRAANLAVVWADYRSLRAEALVVVGKVVDHPEARRWAASSSIFSRAMPAEAGVGQVPPHKRSVGPHRRADRSSPSSPRTTTPKGMASPRSRDFRRWSGKDLAAG